MQFSNLPPGAAHKVRAYIFSRLGSVSWIGVFSGTCLRSFQIRNVRNEKIMVLGVLSERSEFTPLLFLNELHFSESGV